MSLNLPNHYTISFSTNIMLLLQQKGSKLRGTMGEGHYTGKQSSPVDQIGTVEMQQVTGRFGAMPRVDANVDRRWVTPTDFDLPQLIDTFDKLRLLTDPESSYTQNAVFAAGRKIDTVALQATNGTAKTGEQGGTSTTFPAANVISVNTGGANSRLNVAKLLAVKELMQRNFVDFDMEEVYIALTAKDESSLMNEVQVVSSDFNRQEKPVLQEGKLVSFLRMKFVYCELAESVMASSASQVDVPVWAKSGMHIGFWNDISTDISRREDLRGIPWQSYVTGTFGATRIEENRVYTISSFRP